VDLGHAQSRVSAIRRTSIIWGGNPRRSRSRIHCTRDCSSIGDSLRLVDRISDRGWTPWRRVWRVDFGTLYAAASTRTDCFELLRWEAIARLSLPSREVCIERCCRGIVVVVQSVGSSLVGRPAYWWSTLLFLALCELPQRSCIATGLLYPSLRLSEYHCPGHSLSLQ
jgi:hypothetical protein